jgi:cellulose synthase/poly-beta-1,6-N-acetylglucosamine synthase-like glycosyltransferase
MFLDVLLWLSLFYAIQMLALALGTWFARYNSNHAYQPSVSVIIAARNEEGNISRCLTSMSALRYPKEKLDIVVVDDRSTDGTAAIVRQFSAANPTIRLIVAQPESGQLRGKTNAVTQGIEASSGEIIMFTDADCEVQPGWVEETVKYYRDESVGLVAGFTELRAETLFERMQALDWLLLLSIAAGGIRLGFPFTVIGNNLSVRRKAYDAFGGYRKIPFSVTEDYAIFHAVTTQTEYVPRYPLDDKTLILSGPCRSWRELYHQKRRWFTGGRDMEFRHLALFAVTYLYTLLLVVGLPVMWISGQWLPLFVKVVSDFLLLMPTLTSFRRWKLLPGFLLLEIYFTLYVLIFPPIVLTRRHVVWKERSFT